MGMKKIFLSVSFLLTFYVGWCQKMATQNWHWKDYTTDSVHGISLVKAYQQLASLSQKPTPIVVAVIDGGIDTNQLDLKPYLWTNTKEIPGNGIDDDHNGYVDDIRGWNFLGNSKGQNINKAASEKTRIYHAYKLAFENVKIDSTHWSKIQFKQYQDWLDAAKEVEFSDEDAANLQYLKMAFSAIKKIGGILLKELSDSSFTIQTLADYQPISRTVLEAKMAYLRTAPILGIEKETSFKELIEDLSEYIEGKEIAATAKQIPPLNARAIIGDNYNAINDRFYGNADITGPNAKHGTHVAGLVACIPDSSISWSPNCIKIMGVRAVPDGDEYDKDIALAIFYAVDNGAKIINMSFGKSFSPEQPWVDSAIRYAAQKDVLLIHSAGNETYDLDLKSVYPNPVSILYKDTAKNILTIGASSDIFINGTLLTDFSNYGPKIVDVFSPGNKIYSTIPGAHAFGYLQGTSMASPIVCHIAALIRAYYPNLTAIQVKEIIMKSVWKPADITTSFTLPQKDITKTLSQMVASGGIVNAYNALVLAKQVAIKSKIKK